MGRNRRTLYEIKAGPRLLGTASDPAKAAKLMFDALFVTHEPPPVRMLVNGSVGLPHEVSAFFRELRKLEAAAVA